MTRPDVGYNCQETAEEKWRSGWKAGEGRADWMPLETSIVMLQRCLCGDGCWLLYYLMTAHCAHAAWRGDSEGHSPPAREGLWLPGLPRCRWEQRGPAAGMGRGRRVGAGQPGLIAASAGAVPSRHLRPSPRGSWARALSFLQVFVAPVYFPVNEVGRRLRAGCCPWRRRSSEGISSPRLQPAPPPLSRPPPPQAACGSHLPSVRRPRPHPAHPGPRPRPRPASGAVGA